MCLCDDSSGAMLKCTCTYTHIHKTFSFHEARIKNLELNLWANTEHMKENHFNFCKHTEIFTKKATVCSWKERSENSRMGVWVGRGKRMRWSTTRQIKKRRLKRKERRKKHSDSPVEECELWVKSGSVSWGVKCGFEDLCIPLWLHLKYPDLITTLSLPPLDKKWLRIWATC